MSENQAHKKDIPPWREDANSLLIVFSILAATSGVILILVLQDREKFGSLWWLIISLLAIALWLFISTSERITDALDENDVKKYISLFIPYNFAVISLFSGTLLAIYSRCAIASIFFPDCLIIRIITVGVILFIINIRWISHIYWLFRTSDKKYNEYIEELKGTKIPEEDRGAGYDLFVWLRSLISTKK